MIASPPSFNVSAQAQYERVTALSPSKGRDQIRRITKKKAKQEPPHHDFGSFETLGNPEEFGDDIDKRNLRYSFISRSLMRVLDQ